MDLMLRQTYLSLTAALVVGAAAPGGITASPPGAGPSEDAAAVRAAAVLKDVKGQRVGTLRVEDGGNGRTRLTIRTSNLPPGFHGLHIHKKGVCDPRSTDPATGSPFFSAGPHLGSGSHPGHAGDLPGLLVARNGAGTASFVTDRFGVGDLLKAGGTSVVIHAKPDNEANVPARYTQSGKAGPDAETLKAGDSGGRIACGVIQRA
ncbi:superoxide dismutase [Microbispora sp. ATCC PTA-5024]|nr:superoxide dismutase [Microbispora sp. ATCC PTA-5024]